MNINQTIINALKPLNIPIYAVFMDAETEKSAGRPVPDEYITFVYDESPAIYGDDVDLYNEVSVTINYFTSNNPLKTKKAIRKLLRQADFKITDTPVELYESDTKKHHIIIDAGLFVEVDDTEE